MKLTKEISAEQFENVGGIKQTVGDRRRAHESSVRHTSEFFFVFKKPLWTDAPAASCKRTVPDNACHAHDSAGTNPTLALKHTSLFEGEILENLVEKTDAW
jgi:hypothetical protein